MPQKKIVIKLNYSAATLGNSNEAETGPTIQTGWNYKRIVLAFMLLLFLAVALYIGLPGRFSSNQSSNQASFEIIEQPTIRVEEKSTKNNSRTTHINSAQVSVREQNLQRLEKTPVAVIQRDEPSPDSVAAIQPVKSETRVETRSDDNLDTTVASKSVQITISNDPTIIPVSGSGIARVQFTRKMLNREPIGQVFHPVVLPENGTDELYLFTEFRSIKGASRAHEWIKDHQLIAKREFPVGGNRWRVYSRKKLNRTMLGNWTVRITDGEDVVFAEYSFELK